MNVLFFLTSENENVHLVCLTSETWTIQTVRFFVVTVILVVNHTKWTCTCSAVTQLQVLKRLSMWNNFKNPFCVSKLRRGIRFVGNRWLHVNNEKVYWNANSLLLQ